MIVFSIFSKINGIQINHGLIVENRTFLLWGFFFFWKGKLGWTQDWAETQSRPKHLVCTWPDHPFNNPKPFRPDQMGWVGWVYAQPYVQCSKLLILKGRKERWSGALLCLFFFLFFPSKRLESDNYFFFIINYCHLRLDNLGQF